MKLKCLFIAIALACLPLQVLAWDSVGHRLTAAVALEYVSPELAAELIEILSRHPRFEEDFLDAIPDFLDQNNEAELNQWLLGQAAYWPDIARGLPDAERARYNRPAWHYTDGAWVRGAATQQGNVYIDLQPFADAQGQPSRSIVDESQVTNVSRQSITTLWCSLTAKQIQRTELPRFAGYFI